MPLQTLLFSRNISSYVDRAISRQPRLMYFEDEHTINNFHMIIKLGLWNRRSATEISHFEGYELALVKDPINSKWYAVNITQIQTP